MKWLAGLLLILSTQVLSNDVALSCSIPTTRENGDVLVPSEIGGVIFRYEVDGSTRIVDDTDGDCGTELVNLVDGFYTFDVASYDTNGLSSAWSDPISLQLGPIIADPKHGVPTFNAYKFDGIDPEPPIDPVGEMTISLRSTTSGISTTVAAPPSIRNGDLMVLSATVSGDVSSVFAAADESGWVVASFVHDAGVSNKYAYTFTKVAKDEYAPYTFQMPSSQANLTWHFSVFTTTEEGGSWVVNSQSSVEQDDTASVSILPVAVQAGEILHVFYGHLRNTGATISTQPVGMTLLELQLGTATSSSSAYYEEISSDDLSAIRTQVWSDNAGPMSAVAISFAYEGGEIKADNPLIVDVDFSSVPDANPVTISDFTSIRGSHKIDGGKLYGANTASGEVLQYDGAKDLNNNVIVVTIDLDSNAAFDYVNPALVDNLGNGYVWKFGGSTETNIATSTAFSLASIGGSLGTMVYETGDSFTLAMNNQIITAYKNGQLVGGTVSGTFSEAGLQPAVYSLVENINAKGAYSFYADATYSFQSSTGSVNLAGSWQTENDFSSNGFNKTPAYGQNRIEVVSIVAESNAAETMELASVTLGGQTLTAIGAASGDVTGSGGAYHNLLWTGYLTEAQIALMVDDALAINYVTLPNYPFGNENIAAATYLNVDQTAPIGKVSTVNSNGASGNRQQHDWLSSVSGDRVVYSAVNGQPHNEFSRLDYQRRAYVPGGSNDCVISIGERLSIDAGSTSPTILWSGSSRQVSTAYVIKAAPLVFNNPPAQGADLEIDTDNSLGAKVVFAFYEGKDVVTGVSATAVNAANSTQGYDPVKGAYWESNDQNSGGAKISATGLAATLTGQPDISIALFHEVDGGQSYAGSIFINPVDPGWGSPYADVKFSKNANSNIGGDWEAALLIRKPLPDTNTYTNTRTGTSGGAFIDVVGSPFHMLGMTKNNTDTLEFYKDGQPFSSVTSTGTGTDSPTDFNLNIQGDDVYIMSRNSAATGEGLDGRMYLSVIFKDAPTAAEWASFYENPWQIFRAAPGDFAITSVNSGEPLYNGLTSVDIVGNGFGATQGFLAISNVQQPINSWSNNLINIDIDTSLVGIGLALSITKGE